MELRFQDPLNVSYKTIYIALDKNGQIDYAKTRELLTICDPEFVVDKDLSLLTKDKIFKYYEDRGYTQGLTGIPSSGKYIKIVFQKDKNEIIIK